jgi:hypothetical protein
LPNFALSIKIFNGDGFQDIEGSPFTLSVVERDPLLFCETDDVFKAGFCISSESKINSMPETKVAGEQFDVRLENINVYRTNYVPFYDPEQE